MLCIIGHNIEYIGFGLMFLVFKWVLKQNIKTECLKVEEYMKKSVQ